MKAILCLSNYNVRQWWRHKCNKSRSSSLFSTTQRVSLSSSLLRQKDQQPCKLLDHDVLGYVFRREYFTSRKGMLGFWREGWKYHRKSFWDQHGYRHTSSETSLKMWILIPSILRLMICMIMSWRRTRMIWSTQRSKLFFLTTWMELEEKETLQS